MKIKYVIIREDGKITGRGTAKSGEHLKYLIQMFKNCKKYMKEGGESANERGKRTSA